MQLISEQDLDIFWILAPILSSGNPAVILRISKYKDDETDASSSKNVTATSDKIWHIDGYVSSSVHAGEKSWKISVVEKFEGSEEEANV